MPKKAKKLFLIKVENPSPKQGERQWVTVGNASLVEGKFGEMIACRITSIPLNLLQQGLSSWDGTFIITEIVEKEEKTDDTGQTF